MILVNISKPYIITITTLGAMIYIGMKLVKGRFVWHCLLNSIIHQCWKSAVPMAHLSVHLAKRADQLLCLDFSEHAVHWASKRLENLKHVSVQHQKFLNIS